jgi:excisionase family DNA binding protein
MDTKALITVEQAAVEFGVHRATLFRWIEDGRLEKHRQMGDRHTYIDRTDVARLVDPPTVTRALGLIYGEFAQKGEWPRVPELQRRLARDEDDFDLALALENFPRDLGWRVRDAEGRAELTVKGVARCSGSGEVVVSFVNLVRACYDKYVDESDDLVVSSASLAERFGYDTLRLKQLYALVQPEGMFWSGLGMTANGSWTLTVDERVRYFRRVESISDYFAAKQSLIEALTTPRPTMRIPGPSHPAGSPGPHPTIDLATRDLMAHGNWSSAVMAAATAFEQLLATSMGKPKSFGTRLVTAYFDTAARQGGTDGRRIEALQLVATGAFRAFRNQVAHGQRTFSESEAREIIGLFSLLSREAESLPVAPQTVKTGQ